MPKPGEKIKFEDLGVEVIVTKGGDGEIDALPGIHGSDALKVGKRYECELTGIQVLVLKPGSAVLRCADTPMVLQEPKQTKSAD